ncbi:MAG: hypothetical protein ABS32_03825 [Verrucomicrobia subdivision 6 bacterium BACL9 MAG-120820-bin42]|uniref:Uncharacterized protein n=1 Tax=Verrucomicrobia subdivision 6 bacterium BACL9 MAG-120820-bin42 TaxID=1655634 RepID=A0A0R2XDQ1_9BACT|nr:MAG: hypothetical protein ABS32_03825 [Verrucomicrobia subdivision 6 bacterium BACL9 MAG-120820-bin42]
MLTIGRTHGIHAEPTSHGIRMALLHDEFGRAEERLVAAREEIAVGNFPGRWAPTRTWTLRSRRMCAKN